MYFFISDIALIVARIGYKSLRSTVEYLLALQLAAGLLVVSEELHGVHVRHVNLVGQQAISPGRSHLLDILICYQGLRRQTDLHFLPNSNMDSLPGHLWELVRVVDVNFPPLKEVIRGAGNLQASLKLQSSWNS